MADDTQNTTDEVEEKVGDLKDKATSNGGGGGVLSSLMSKEILIPALVTAGGVAAYAAKKGASGAKQKAEEEAENMGNRAAEGAKKNITGGLGGGIGGLAKKAIPGVGGGGSGSGGAKKTRRLPIQRWTDIAAPIDTVWDRWTEFEEYPNFMHRVLSVKTDEDDDSKVQWEEKIWFSKRQWEGEITERRKNERIAWKTTSGMAHSGVVTFHKIEKNLTRVMVDMDFVPQGMFEKMASGLRFVKRAVQADLARFKAYVELGEAKELEYHAKPAEREGDDSGDDNGDENQNQGDEDENQDNEDENQSSSNGNEREDSREKAGASA